ncbi:MAG TPA: response regulator [Polaromonas sp.]|nr:response regulator [Polaromonas sp.]
MARRVFIVEDSPLTRATISDGLQNLNFEVVGVADCEDDAKVWLDANPDGWDLAIVDLFLREGTGAGVVRYSRRRGYLQPIVVVTNHYIPDIVDHTQRLGADTVLKKSDDLEELWKYCATLPL